MCTPGSWWPRVVSLPTVEQRPLGRTGRSVSVVGLGTWQLGGDWGQVDDRQALDVLATAVEAGVTLLDTADVYGDGRSETLIGQFLRDNAGLSLTVATKMGRRADQVPASYVFDNFRAWTDRSRRNLRVDRLDLVQLHCPPGEVYADPAVYDALDTLVDEGRVAAYGVSVETVDQALEAMAHPGVASVQVILNAFRQKPVETVLPVARERDVAILARVPLASGLLSGRFREDTQFAADDHRSFNRHGEAFDVGETFAGVDYGTGVAAAREFAAIAEAGGLPDPVSLALRWVLDQRGVTTVIPGASRPQQARANAAAADLAPLDAATTDAVRRLYDDRIRPLVHDRW
jgi:aryl-alcohol dehydrogenase-like predicted oxidoreductase